MTKKTFIHSSENSVMQLNSTTLEKMLLKYAAFRGRTLFGCLISVFLAWQRAALKSFWVRIMVFSEKMVCIHTSDDENAVIRMGTVQQTLGWK